MEHAAHVNGWSVRIHGLTWIDLSRTGQTCRISHRVSKHIAERIAARPQRLHSGAGVIDGVGVSTIGSDSDRSVP